MKNGLLLVAFVICLISCKKIDQEADPEFSQKQTLMDTITSADKDENGCLDGAGYFWSALNKECIKIYESAITLYPQENQNNEDETKNAYIVFAENGGNEVEVFLPNQVKSIILIRPAEGQPWQFDEWQLVPWKGFMLKKGEEILFSGDGSIGPKVTGSDKIED
ncbi:hypothetical protein [Flavobacterium sp.]|jgi:hypothetical protein|uniref:hypothetical protein n=1 Tax=Flavobacterium sp. TaxID=239 RepID=UPI0037C0B276